MKKSRKDKDFVKSPYFEGGRTAMDTYVKNELRYPKEALAAKVEGRVSLRYTVDYKGKVTDAHVISGIGHGCDEEALRIVRSFSFKVPEDGKIKSKYSRKVHIHFRLPGSPAKPVASTKKVQLPENKNTVPAGSFQVTYQVTQKPSNTPKPISTKSTSYQINITIPGKGNPN